MLFSAFPYDYPLLWTSVTPSADYLSALEKHLQFLHASPAIIPRILHIVIAVGLLGFIVKLYKPSEANVLFDGASLVLFVVGITIYLTNIVQGLRIVSSGEYGEGAAVQLGPEGSVGREEALKVLAASNTILALVLIGVLVLQAGQWYAEKKEGQEVESFRLKEEAEKAEGKHKAAHRGGAGGKKKN